MQFRSHIIPDAIGNAELHGLLQRRLAAPETDHLADGMRLAQRQRERTTNQADAEDDDFLNCGSDIALPCFTCMVHRPKSVLRISIKPTFFVQNFLKYELSPLSLKNLISLIVAVYSCFGIFIVFLSISNSILRYPWKTIFRGKVSKFNHKNVVFFVILHFHKSQFQTMIKQTQAVLAPVRRRACLRY